VTAYQKIVQYDNTRPFWPWLHRIVTNNALQWLRKHKALQFWDDGLESLDDPSPSPASHAAANSAP
jgi:DNA-directed RNA polymerase specialized sigma24 family protein